MVNDGFNLVAIDDLNTLEQCLLILALREKDPEAATAIADRIKLQKELVKEVAATNNKIFDTVLSLNALKAEEQEYSRRRHEIDTNAALEEHIQRA